MNSLTVLLSSSSSEIENTKSLGGPPGPNFFWRDVEVKSGLYLWFRTPKSQFLASQDAVEVIVCDSLTESLDVSIDLTDVTLV